MAHMGVGGCLYSGEEEGGGEWTPQVLEDEAQELEYKGKFYMVGPSGTLYDHCAWNERYEMVVVGNYDGETVKASDVGRKKSLKDPDSDQGSPRRPIKYHEAMEIELRLAASQLTGQMTKVEKADLRVYPSSDECARNALLEIRGLYERKLEENTTSLAEKEVGILNEMEGL